MGMKMTSNLQLQQALTLIENSFRSYKGYISRFEVDRLC